MSWSRRRHRGAHEVEIWFKFLPWPEFEPRTWLHFTSLSLCERMFQLYTYLKAFRLSGIYVCTWSERAWTCRRLPLGPTFKFRALCTAAVSISCSARFV